MWFSKKKKSDLAYYEETLPPEQSDFQNVNIVQEAFDLLQSHGYDVVVTEKSLTFKDCDLNLYPELVDVAPSEGGRTRTVTIIRAQHPVFFPEGLFEYQHGQGTSVREAVLFGLGQWVQLDIPVLLDASRTGQITCMKWDVAFPSEDGQSEKTRHVFLGPTAHFAENYSAADAAKANDDEEHHDFCPCCMLTNSIEAFQPLFREDDTFGVRLFAARDAKGEVSADCRINGVDFEEGKKALLNYARSWPDQGFEFRKQYVVFRNALKVNE